VPLTGILTPLEDKLQSLSSKLVVSVVCDISLLAGGSCSRRALGSDMRFVCTGSLRQAAGLQGS
jgi:hypothetical protein